MRVFLSRGWPAAMQKPVFVDNAAILVLYRFDEKISIVRLFLTSFLRRLRIMIEAIL